MLSSKDVSWLTEELIATIEAMGGEANLKVVGMMVADFRVFPKHQLKEALHRVRMEGTSRLTPKVLLDQLDAINGRLGADEAFALVLKAKDETQTVVWTDEVAQAWAAVYSMVQSKDQVGARMAFKQAYERIAQDARAQLKRPVPAYTLGSDRKLRIVAIEQAHKHGRLSMAMALEALEGVGRFDAKENTFVAIDCVRPEPLKLLPAPEGSSALGQILTNKPAVSGILPANVVEHIKKAREAAAKSAARTKRRQQAMKRLERMKFAKRQREIGAAVQQHLNQQQKGTEQ